MSEYNLFEGAIDELNPVDGLIPYNLNTPLFSDYAQKFRLLYIPRGLTLSYSDSGVLDFPQGSVLVKNFFYELDQRIPSSDRYLLETRLLLRNRAGWSAETYVWNEEQTEAFRKQTGEVKQVRWSDREGLQRNVDYLIPSKNDCKNCHSKNGKLLPLGPKIRNLNKTYIYETGEENQLDRWEKEGVLRDKPGSGTIPKAPVWDEPSTGTLEERARIYLDVNCAHCHSRGGSANNSGLFLSLGEPDPYRLGVCKSPVATGTSLGGLRYDIVPCQPDSSILVYRMSSVEPHERMPELGRTLVHEEAVELIRDWIMTLDCTTCDGGW